MKYAPIEGKRSWEKTDKSSRDDKSDRSNRPYTPLTRPLAELIEIMLHKQGFYRPARVKNLIGNQNQTSSVNFIMIMGMI